MKKLTQKYLRGILDYNKLTGVFTWKVEFSKKIKSGCIAGTVNDKGYRIITIHGRLYRAHRLAFLYIKGSTPKEQVDHINRERDDNKWSNLRECCDAENRYNKPPRQKGSSKYKGVHFHKSSKKWYASINAEGKTFFLGSFNSEIKAAKKYNTAASKYHKNYAYLNEL